MSKITEIQNEIIEEFNFFPDWTEKYEYLIELGKKLPLIRDEFKDDDHLIKGCQSKVWLRAESKDGLVVYSADSDAIITKGIIALLLRVLSGQTPQAILEEELFFIDKIGLTNHLSPTRANGLLSMVKQIKMDAMVLRSEN
ncbi:MAG: SufE family protein [Saprospiraceae bacterium]|jgi:cysteine desulfuration protein SufE